MRAAASTADVWSPSITRAARRNYVIFGIAACFGVTALVAVVTMLLV